MVKKNNQEQLIETGTILTDIKKYFFAKYNFLFYFQKHFYFEFRKTVSTILLIKKN